MGRKLNSIESHYKNRNETEKEDYKILDWESEEEHMKRFCVFTDSFPDMSNSSILDVGCGLGNFAEYLDRTQAAFCEKRKADGGHFAKKNICVKYSGVDILPDMICLAAQKKFSHIKAEFIETDIFGKDSIIKNKAYDYIFASGIFNLNLGNNIDFFENALKLFFTAARKGICFNLLDSYAEEKFGDKYFYYEKKDIESRLNIYKDKILKYSIEEFRHDFSFCIHLK